MQNQFDVILSKLTEEEKNEIVTQQKVNLNDMNGKNMYNGHALDYFFRMWHRHFPNVRQSKTCKGCRDGVVKFYHGVADLISQQINDAKQKLKEEEELKAPKKIVKAKSKKNKSKK
ncbi:MAG: hypothetical protein Unbinned8210contig1002_12 [Prokaryotic dsDNA virus sp.]|nr:MAG: hypothetical protein Unbinned8210contig1002_12 [Prokaryotic dsDNA virus sp.]|tara:strand:+ start:14580 stop:14927 length:348 start_codon:yes stop_codon:yes gene_type:complete